MKHPIIREYSFIITYTTYDEDEIFLDPKSCRHENAAGNDSSFNLGIQTLLML